MKQAMKKNIDVFQRGTHATKPDDVQRKASACECEINRLLSLIAYGKREWKIIEYKAVGWTFIFQISFGLAICTRYRCLFNKEISDLTVSEILEKEHIP